MLKDITLGQYFPGDTVVHKLDPRTKLILTIVYIAALFIAKGPISYGLVFLFLAAAVALSRVKVSALFRGLKPLLIIIILTAVLNLFYTKGDVLVSFWIFTITKQGIISAFFMVSHSMEEVAGNAERIVVVNDSHIAMDGTPPEVFSRAEELLAMGLDVPQITRLFLRLRELGMDVDPAVYTVDQAKRQLLGGKGGTAKC